LVFEQVCLDLEAEGYEVQPFIIPAAAKNAPHRRDRIWFVATHSDNLRSGEQKKPKEQPRGAQARSASKNIEPSTANTTYAQLEGLERHNRERKGCTIDRNNEGLFIGTKNQCFASNVHGNGFQQCNGNDEIEPSERRINAQCNTNTGDVDGNVADTIGIGLQRKGGSTKLEGRRFSFDNTQNNKTTWDNFPTQSPICGGDDGIPTELDRITFSKWRAESIKGYGNAIVPQVAFELFQVIEKINCNLSK